MTENNAARVPTFLDLEGMTDTLESRLAILEMAVAGRDKVAMHEEQEARAFAYFVSDLSNLAMALRRVAHAGIKREAIEVPSSPY